MTVRNILPHISNVVNQAAQTGVCESLDDPLRETGIDIDGTTDLLKISVETYVTQSIL